MAVMVIGIAVALSIYITFNLFKRPISLERSGEIGGIVAFLLRSLPMFLMIVVLPLFMLSLPFAALAWMFHPTWLPSFFARQIETAFFGIPAFVWFGVIILVYWIGMFSVWLRERGQRKN